MAAIHLDLEYPAIHWIRKSRSKRSYCRVAWSPEALALWHCLHSSNSALLVFCRLGLERIILEYIAMFAGWAILQPCHCCRNEPLVFCLEQHKTFLVKDLGEPMVAPPQIPEIPRVMVPGHRMRQPGPPQIPEDDTDGPDIPLVAFRGGRMLLHEERIPVRVVRYEVWIWDSESQKEIEKIYENPAVRRRPSLPGFQLGGSGIGYIVFNEWGFIAPYTSAAWTEVNWTTVKVSQGSNGEGSIDFRFEKKQSLPFPMRFDYEVYESVQAMIYREEAGRHQLNKELSRVFCYRVTFSCKFRTKNCVIQFIKALAYIKHNFGD